MTGVMTERLYYTDAYLDRFAARVVDRSADGQRIYLDRTAFYPTSGGSRTTSARSAAVAVVDVVDEDARVAHLLAAPLEGDEVEGVVDRARRRDHRQQHTGQHLLSAIAADRFGWETLSVHFGPDIVDARPGRRVDRSRTCCASSSAWPTSR